MDILELISYDEEKYALMMERYFQDYHLDAGKFVGVVDYNGRKRMILSRFAYYNIWFMDEPSSRAERMVHC